MSLCTRDAWIGNSTPTQKKWSGCITIIFVGQAKSRIPIHRDRLGIYSAHCMVVSEGLKSIQLRSDWFSNGGMFLSFVVSIQYKVHQNRHPAHTVVDVLGSLGSFLRISCVLHPWVPQKCPKRAQMSITVCAIWILTPAYSDSTKQYWRNIPRALKWSDLNQIVD